jgi:hypothetical protein
MGAERPTPEEQVRRLYEEQETRLASAAEELVGRDSFGELLARLTENVMAVTRIGNDVFDLAVRNLRLASRQDVTRLARQLARTEDKLELVLQEVERLQGRLDGGAPAASEGAGGPSGPRRRTRAGGGSRSGRSGGGRAGGRSSGGGRAGGRSSGGGRAGGRSGSRSP